MSGEGSETNNLIAELSADLKPQSPMLHPLFRALPWVLLSVGYIVVVTMVIGVRHDWAMKMAQPTHLFEILLAASVAITAALSSFWMCVPAMKGQISFKAVPVTLFSVFLVWVFCRATVEGVNPDHMYLNHCFYEAVFLGAIPAVALIIFCKSGTTVKPNWMAAMNVLAVTMMGWIALRFTCGGDSLGHAFVYHFFPFLVFAFLMAVTARRLFKW